MYDQDQLLLLPPSVKVRGTQAPDAAREMDVVRVVHLGEVVDRTGRLRVEEGVTATIVVDRQVALFDIDVGRAVLAHGARA